MHGCTHARVYASSDVSIFNCMAEEEEEFTPHLTLFKTSKDREAVVEANKCVRLPLVAAVTSVTDGFRATSLPLSVSLAPSLAHTNHHPNNINAGRTAAGRHSGGWRSTFLASWGWSGSGWGPRYTPVKHSTHASQPISRPYKIITVGGASGSPEHGRRRRYEWVLSRGGVRHRR